ncbi:MAG: hypothetical protein AB7S44_01740 [Spirochaetales bacterium]
MDDLNLKTSKDKKKRFTPVDLEDLKDKLDKREIGFFRNLTTKRYTKKVSRDIIIGRLISIGMILILLTIGVVYSLSYTYVNSGYGINVIADQRITKAVSLSDDDNFQRLSVGLKASAITSLDNISYSWLPPGLDDLGGGSHNGDNYICYTFYVLNTGDADLTYTSDLRIKLSTQSVETAMRVEIFSDGVPTVYTHTYEEQIDGEIEGTGVTVEEFYSLDTIAHDVVNLSLGSYDRYTVVIWLEGADYDCVNDKFSSELQMIWNISVIEDEEV